MILPLPRQARSAGEALSLGLSAAKSELQLNESATQSTSHLLTIVLNRVSLFEPGPSHLEVGAISHESSVSRSARPSGSVSWRVGAKLRALSSARLQIPATSAGIGPRRSRSAIQALACRRVLGPRCPVPRRLHVGSALLVGVSGPRQRGGSTSIFPGGSACPNPSCSFCSVRCKASSVLGAAALLSGGSCPTPIELPLRAA
jgi:hypothetical protein